MRKKISNQQSGFGVFGAQHTNSISRQKQFDRLVIHLNRQFRKKMNSTWKWGETRGMGEEGGEEGGSTSGSQQLGSVVQPKSNVEM
jgi:hypothetical protein